jgi:malonyl-CoA/methylmalonyl-CoA synthetase
MHLINESHYITAKLIEHYEHQPENVKQEISNVLKNKSKIRLMVSGSAALPPSVMNKWKQISGHFLLEAGFSPVEL